MKYSISTLRRKANNIGLTLSKNYLRYMHNNSCVFNEYGKPISGYSLMDNQTGFCIPECYDNVYRNTMTLNDVYEYLKNVYKAKGLYF